MGVSTCRGLPGVFISAVTPSTRPAGRKTKPSGSTSKRISHQGRFDALALLILHQSCLYARRTFLSDFAMTTKLWTILPYLTSTHCHSSGNHLTRQKAESGLQGWTWRMGTTWEGLQQETWGRQPFLPRKDSLSMQWCHLAWQTPLHQFKQWWIPSSKIWKDVCGTSTIFSSMVMRQKQNTKP